MAGASIGISEDTVLDWKNKDKDFADQMDKAKSEWATEQVEGVKSKEWLLERLMNDHFGEKKKIELDQTIHLTDEQLNRIIKD